MEESKKPIPQWLQNLQENSWEIELLISGGAVFTLLQFPEIFMNFIRTAKISSDIPGTSLIMIMGMAGIKILTNGFILHLLLRSYWLAMVCLNYIYPQGINAGKMKRAKPFRSRHVDGDLQDQIMNVDRISALVIFMTIISTLVLGGLVVGILAVVSIMELLAMVGLMVPELDELFGFSMLFYFIDLLFMGVFRKIPILSWILFPVFWIFDLITFRSFYSRPLALFSSNINRNGFVAGAFVFVVFTGVTTYIPLVRAMHLPRLFDARQYRDQLTSSNKVLVDWYYADHCEPEKVGVVSIPSHLIENNFLNVNLRYDRWMDGLLDHSNPDRSKRILSDLIQLSIDDSLYQDVEWMETRKVDYSQLGLVALIDISRLPNGPHRVIIESKEIQNPAYLNLRASLQYKVSIPFWKDVF
ncbi:MAG TPA: hypothetical protein PKY12_07520 [Catalimonadaceae bacterium]|nr:hypothetical protein [Catalimonadaceae bacterium]